MSEHSHSHKHHYDRKGVGSGALITFSREANNPVNRIDLLIYFYRRHYLRFRNLEIQHKLRQAHLVWNFDLGKLQL